MASDCLPTVQVESGEKSVFFQTQLSIRLNQELHNLELRIEGEEAARLQNVSQARACP